VATQRLAKLAKNVAAEASNFLMGRTFLDIDMQRAADLLGMDRRQAERIRDLQRGQFLGLGPAISRRPVAVSVGPVRTGARSGGGGLLPLPEAGGEDMEALLNDRLAEAASEPVTRRPPPPPRPAADIEQALRAVPPPVQPAPSPVSVPEQEYALTSAPAPALPLPVAEPALVSTTPEAIVHELALSEGATFRPATALFRDFAIRCRQQGVASAHIDIARFRRMFACAIGGLGRLEGNVLTQVEAIIAGVEDDVLAPFLAMAVAEALGEPMPNEDELARLYGSSSPSRIRRLLDHLERSGLIVVREEFGGGRIITVPALSASAKAIKAA
jgi:hypothetical protein